MKKVSVLVTTHNKENLIDFVCHGIRNNISENVNQIIVVFDGCTDSTEEKTKSIFSDIDSSVKIDYVHTDDIFELKANNEGMKLVENDYVLSIQDDMVIKEKNFDQRMLEPFLKFNDVFSVTSFVAHNNTFNERTGGMNYIDIANKDNSSRDIFYAREYANRGPIMYDYRDFVKLNYYDEWFAPCSYDDLDICLRAVKELNKVSGLYWIEYTSKINWGTSRNKNQEFFQKQYFVNAKKIHERHQDILSSNNKIVDNRKMK